MPITVSGTTITFNDATTQTTAASPSSYVGGRGQVFTSSGTFTVPTGVTSVKVDVIGGGGGGGNCNSTGGTAMTASGGAGGGGRAIEFVTGLTPGGTVSVTVASSVGAATAGGTSSFGAYCSATGGAAGQSVNAGNTGSGGAGGAGSGGDINITGGAGGDASKNDETAYGMSGPGGAGSRGSYAAAGTETKVGGAAYLGGNGGSSVASQNTNVTGLSAAANAYGAGGSGCIRYNGGTVSGGSGAGGIVIVEY